MQVQAGHIITSASRIFGRSPQVMTVPPAFWCACISLLSSWAADCSKHDRLVPFRPQRQKCQVNLDICSSGGAG